MADGSSASFERDCAESGSVGSAVDDDKFFDADGPDDDYADRDVASSPDAETGDHRHSAKARMTKTSGMTENSAQMSSSSTLKKGKISMGTPAAPKSGLASLSTRTSGPAHATNYKPLQQHRLQPPKQPKPPGQSPGRGQTAASVSFVGGAHMVRLSSGNSLKRPSTQVASTPAVAASPARNSGVSGALPSPGRSSFFAGAFGVSSTPSAPVTSLPDNVFDMFEPTVPQAAASSGVGSIERYEGQRPPTGLMDPAPTAAGVTTASMQDFLSAPLSDAATADNDFMPPRPSTSVQMHNSGTPTRKTALVPAPVRSRAPSPAGSHPQQQPMPGQLSGVGATPSPAASLPLAAFASGLASLPVSGNMRPLAPPPTSGGARVMPPSSSIAAAGAAGLSVGHPLPAAAAAGHHSRSKSTPVASAGSSNRSNSSPVPSKQTPNASSVAVRSIGAPAPSSSASTPASGSAPASARVSPTASSSAEHADDTRSGQPNAAGHTHDGGGSGAARLAVSSVRSVGNFSEAASPERELVRKSSGASNSSRVNRNSTASQAVTSSVSAATAAASSSNGGAASDNGPASSSGGANALADAGSTHHGGGARAVPGIDPDDPFASSMRAERVMAMSMNSASGVNGTGGPASDDDRPEGSAGDDASEQQQQPRGQGARMHPAPANSQSQQQHNQSGGSINRLGPQKLVRRGCLGAAAHGIELFKDTFGLTPPRRIPGCLTAHVNRKDLCELSALALCQRLEHSSAAYVRLALARQQIAQAQVAAAALLDRRASGVSTSSSEQQQRGGGLFAATQSDVSMNSSMAAGGAHAAAAAAAAATAAASDALPDLPARAPLESVWAMKFSPDGQFLAVAGGTDQGAVIRIWRVLPWPERERMAAAAAEQERHRQRDQKRKQAAASPDRQRRKQQYTSGKSMDERTEHQRSADGMKDRSNSVQSTVSNVSEATRSDISGFNSTITAAGAAGTGLGAGQYQLSQSQQLQGIDAIARKTSQSSYSTVSIGQGGRDQLGNGADGYPPSSPALRSVPHLNLYPQVRHNVTMTPPAAGAARLTGAHPRNTSTLPSNHKRSRSSKSIASVTGPISASASTAPSPGGRRGGGGQDAQGRSHGGTASNVNGTGSDGQQRQAALDGLVTHGQPLLDPVPVREWLGHEAHVVDLSWSRTNLLLSASMDGCVRLWHVSRPECLHKFMHPDCVTSVAFHPHEENLFVTGCFDRKLRMWSLETGRVTVWQAAPSMITAAAFSPDGRYLIAGLFNGIAMLFHAHDLKLRSSLDCRNRRGPFRHGKKVTGIEFTPNGSHALITTNDSRVRMIDLLSLQTVTKYIGLHNRNMQVRASFGPGADRVVSGSEDGCVYVWRTRNDQFVPAINPRLSGYDWSRVRSYECFVSDEGAQDIDVEVALRSEEAAELGPKVRPAVTVAIFAPAAAIAIARPPPAAAQWCIEPTEATSSSISSAGVKLLQSSGAMAAAGNNTDQNAATDRQPGVAGAADACWTDGAGAAAASSAPQPGQSRSASVIAESTGGADDDDDSHDAEGGHDANSVDGSSNSEGEGQQPAKHGRTRHQHPRLAELSESQRGHSNDGGTGSSISPPPSPRHNAATDDDAVEGGDHYDGIPSRDNGSGASSSAASSVGADEKGLEHDDYPRRSQGRDRGAGKGSVTGAGSVKTAQSVGMAGGIGMTKIQLPSVPLAAPLGAAFRQPAPATQAEVEVPIHAVSIQQSSHLHSRAGNAKRTTNISSGNASNRAVMDPSAKVASAQAAVKMTGHGAGVVVAGPALDGTPAHAGNPTANAAGQPHSLQHHQQASLAERLDNHVIIIAADSRGVIRIYENCGLRARV